MFPNYSTHPNCTLWFAFHCRGFHYRPWWHRRCKPWRYKVPPPAGSPGYKFGQYKLPRLTKFHYCMFVSEAPSRFALHTPEYFTQHKSVTHTHYFPNDNLDYNFEPYKLPRLTTLPNYTFSP